MFRIFHVLSESDYLRILGIFYRIYLYSFVQIWLLFEEGVYFLTMNHEFPLKSSSMNGYFVFFLLVLVVQRYVFGELVLM